MTILLDAALVLRNQSKGKLTVRLATAMKRGARKCTSFNCKLVPRGWCGGPGGGGPGGGGPGGGGSGG